MYYLQVTGMFFVVVFCFYFYDNVLLKNLFNVVFVSFILKYIKYLKRIIKVITELLSL